MNLYEGMFLLDNQVVRADWKTAKNAVLETLKKHGGEVVSARRWDERKLAYAIRGRRRGTYLLTYYKAAPQNVGLIRRDIELDERILRYLVLCAEAVPEPELELSKAELAEGFTVPPPPQDDEVVVEAPEVAAEPAPELSSEELAVPETAETEA
jgi:small subunit ribosomal protein S6